MKHLQANDMLHSDMEGVLWALSSFLLARRELLPFIQDGNKGCGGRLRCAYRACLCLSRVKLPKSNSLPNHMVNAQSTPETIQKPDSAM